MNGNAGPLVHILPPGGEKFKSLGLIEEEIAELSCLDGELVKRREELEERFGEGVISLVEKEQFGLNWYTT